MKKRLLIVIALGLLLLLVGTALYRYRPKVLYSSSKQAQTPAEVWHVQAVPAWTLVRGQELLYDLSYSGSGRFPAQKTDFSMSLTGTLRIQVLGEEDDDYRVWLSLQAERPTQLKDVPLAMRASLQKGWSEGIAARLEGRGFHLTPVIGRDVDPTVAQFWQTLSERLQVDLPAILQAPVWEQTEAMAGGSVRVRYEMDPTLLKPAMLGERMYLQKAFDGAPLPHKKISGESLILLQPHFEGVNQLEAETREVQDFNGQSFLADSTVKLHWQKQGQVDEARLTALDHRWGQSGSGKAPSSQETSIQKAALGSLGLDEIWALINQAGSQNSQELYLKLKAWVYLHPDEMNLLLDRLKGLDEGDPALKMAIRALAAAGQPQAQDALVDLLDQRRADVPLARKIITTLGFAGEPTRKTQQALIALSEAAEDSPVRRSSRLALGIVGQRLSQSSDPEARQRAAEVEALVLRQLRSATGLAAIKDALAALGNCGVTRIEDLNPWLQHPDPSVRGQAFFALRYARPESTPNYLVSHYASEAAAEVRRQITQALSLRTPDANWFQAVTRLLDFSVTDEEKIVLAKTLMGTVRQHKESSMKILDRLLANTQDATLAKYREIVSNQKPM